MNPYLKFLFISGNWALIEDIFPILDHNQNNFDITLLCYLLYNIKDPTTGRYLRFHSLAFNAIVGVYAEVIAETIT